MLKLKKVAITGGIASGKSTVCQLFQELGAYIVNADTIAHELLNSKTDLGKQVLRKFGTLDRKLLAEKVFRDPKLLRELEQFLHPEIIQNIEQKYKKACEAKKYTSFVVEIPLLYEIGAETFYDAVIAVVTDEKIAKERYLQQGQKEDEYERRMRRQLSPEQKAKSANFIIKNNGSLSDLKKQVEAVNVLISEHSIHES